MIAGMGGAVIVILAGLLWNWCSNGGLVRLLGGVTADELSDRLLRPAGSGASAKWEAFANKKGYNSICDYRKAAKISIDLLRYASESSFIYPTIVSDHFLQGLINEPGEPIAVDLNDTDSGGCAARQAILSNLPGMCFDTKIEQRC
jgi:hypothetical protein